MEHKPTSGSASEAAPARKDVTAPSPISEFMSGRPLQHDTSKVLLQASDRAPAGRCRRPLL